MKYPTILFLPVLFFYSVVIAQTKSDSSEQKIPHEKHQVISPSIKNKFETKSSFKLFKEDFTLPYDLKRYSSIMSLDIPINREIKKEEINSGLTEDEIESFRQNKSSTMRMLSDFYGVDLVNIQKLLDSIGLTKDQIVGILMVLKFAFGQALIK